MSIRGIYNFCRLKYVIIPYFDSGGFALWIYYTTFIMLVQCRKNEYVWIICWIERLLKVMDIMRERHLFKREKNKIRQKPALLPLDRFPSRALLSLNLPHRRFF